MTQTFKNSKNFSSDSVTHLKSIAGEGLIKGQMTKHHLKRKQKLKF